MWWLTRTLIEASGGHAIHFDESKNKGFVPAFDGLVLGGGGDIDPQLYGEKPLEGIKHEFDRRQDEQELELLRQALERGLPVLGVCRGIQIINVYFGGTLHQDISKFFPAGKVRESRLPFKNARIEEKSQLAQTLLADEIPINSMHTQAVKRLADQLKAVAREEVGLIQGLEGELQSPLLAVQWHPEFMPYIHGHRNLYKWIVRMSAH